MAAREDEPELVVADRRPRERIGLVDHGLLLLPGPARLAAQSIERPVAGHGGEPSRRAFGQASGRPLLERDQDRLRHSVLRSVEVSGQPAEGGQDPATLHPQDLLEGVVHARPVTWG